MSEPSDLSGPNLAGPDPDAIAGHSFTRSRKGYDSDEVRAYLVSLASQLREAQRLTADQGRRLAELERRGVDPKELDEDQVTQLLGEETARVLDTARKAGAEIRTKAQDAADELTNTADAQATATRDAASQYDQETRSAADDYASTTRGAADTDADDLRTAVAAEVAQLREDAERVLADRTAEAEAAADAIRAEGDTYKAQVQGDADTYAADVRAQADAYGADARGQADTYASDLRAQADAALADALREAESSRAATAAAAAAGRDQAEVDAEAIRDVARTQGREMVDEARTYRERVIADLADRRRSVRAQLDQLAATRDALAVTLTDVSGRIDASQKSLADAVIDPRDLGDVAADRAALTDPEPEPALEAATPAGGVGLDVDVEPEAVEPEPEPEVDPVEAEVDARDDELEAAALAEEAPAPEPEPEPEPEPAAVEPEPEIDLTDEPTAVVEVVDIADPAAPSTEVSGDDPAAAVFAKLKADVEPTDPAGATEASSSPEPGATLTAAEPEAVDESDPDTDLLDRRDATVDELERTLARRLKRVLSDEQNEALDRLRQVKGQATAGDVLVSEEDHLQRYLAAALEDLTAAERAGAGFFGEALPEKAADVSDVAHAFASDLVRALRGRLEAAFDDGGDEHEIGERIRACYREWKTQRIAEVATHYVLVAFGRGVAAAGADGSHRWLVDDGGSPCPDCDDNALAGPVPSGEEFPTGDLHPPSHPGCRCLQVPA